jgi:hypothetical protein
MRGVKAVARAALATLATLAALPAPSAAAAGPPPPSNLWIAGGEDSWHAENRFQLYWENTVPEGGSPVAAIHYRIRNALGAVVLGETRIGGPVTSVDNLRVPTSGTYDADVWLEDAAGNQGAPATAKLRFDNVRPDEVAPLPVSGWISRTGFPYMLRVGHPQGEPPLSGIRGYAVSIDSAPNSDPCAEATRCTDAETDLHGGADDDSLAIAGLPQGSSYVHVVAVSGSGMKSAIPGHAMLRVDTNDPATELTGVPSGWANQPVRLTATARDAGSGMSGAQDGEPFTAIRIDDGTPRIGTGSSVSATVIVAGVHRIAYYARDAAGNVNDGSTANTTANASPSTAVVRIDREAPTAAFANSQVPGDPELIQLRIRDPLSGPDPSRGWIGVRRAGSGDRFEPLPAEPADNEPRAGDGLQARWDSAAYPPGEYEFWAIGYDRAGNASTTTRRSDGTAMVLPNPLKTPTTLRVGFAGRAVARTRCLRRGALRRCRREAAGKLDRQWRLERRGGLRLVSFGRGIMLRGRLIAGTGTPLESMAVRIVERFGAGAGPAERVSTLRTDARGDFAIQLPAGPSRQVVAEFDGTPALARSVAPPAGLGVRSGVRLRVSSSVASVGGRPIVFRGGVAAAEGTSAAGKAVQLQFRLPGVPWSEFRTVQTDGRGRFRLAYRFSDDDSRGARFQFRAYVPTQRDWPYEPAGSRPVAVRGR